MTFQNLLSKQMGKAIKDNTTPLQRKSVAIEFGISIHTLNSVLNSQRKVSNNNLKAIVEIIRVAIHSANSKGFTLTQYKEEIKKAAEAALSDK
tara:strand:+ start:720 stop:998 length:279 start_codon:yes stop_codon:yes gene_type:complete